MRKIVILAILAAAMSTAACNTIKGAGEDVSAAGDAVSDTAEQAKPN
ncbi:MAG: entericidin A/B family lipoprotein [Caulobacter sp.]|nr:entericidin A/B family lipoprotein [Caulobacter sp.]